jgi:hypothetical protein
MLYAILCYNSEAAVGSWSKQYHDETMGRLMAVQDKLDRQGRLGPVARLLPTTAATTLRKGREEVVIDGPFAETKELVAGYWIWQVKSMDEAIEWVRRCPDPMPGEEAEIEIRPLFEADDFGKELTPELRAQAARLEDEIARQRRS